MVRDVPDGVFTLTMHPQVIGRGHRLLMLEAVIAVMKATEGIDFSTMRDAADAFRTREASRPHHSDGDT